MGRIVAVGAGLLVSFVVLFIMFGSWYTIDQGERGVLLTNGAYTAVKGPGLHFKTPWFQSVVKVNTRQQVYTWGFAGGDGVMQAYSKDQQAADMRVTINWRVPEGEVAKVYSEYGSVEALGSRTVGRQAPQEIKTVFGQYDAVSVIQSRAKFNADVEAQVRASVAGMPVLVDSVQVENIDFSDAYEQAVEARMQAQVEVQRRQQELEREVVQAKIAVTQAQAEADSTKARADAEAYRTRLQGEAEAGAIKARAAALAANGALVELTKAERWDGKLPTSMLPSGTIPFLEVGR